MARAGQIFSFVCDENQVSRILRVIVDNDGLISDKTSKPEGVFMTVRKT